MFIVPPMKHNKQLKIKLLITNCQEKLFFADSFFGFYTFATLLRSAFERSENGRFARNCDEYSIEAFPLDLVTDKGAGIFIG